MEAIKPERSRSYTLAFKLETLNKLDELNGNISATAKYFSIPRSCVQDWIKQKEKLIECSSDKSIEVRKRRNLPSENERAKKRAKFPEMENILVDWIREERKAGRLLNGLRIKMRADQILKSLHSNESSDIGEIDFKASSGWLDRFLKRHNIVSRSVTSVGQKIPENARELCNNFFDYFDRTSKDLDISCIGNMDESPLWFDLPTQKTFDFKGVKVVPCKTTGKEKLRYTVVLSAMANGVKLKPMIIFKGLKNIPRVEFPKEVVVTVAMKGSMNTDLMNIYKQKVWGRRPNSFFKPRSLLVLDSAKPHLKPTVKSSFKQHYKTELAVIPGGLTPVLQPADVHWNKQFKSEMKRLWTEWLVNGESEFTKSGNRRSASYSTIAQWVKLAWEKVPNELIVKSFMQCGLSSERSSESLHSRLKELMMNNTIDAECGCNENESGLTDIESEESESEE